MNTPRRSTDDARIEALVVRMQEKIDRAIADRKTTTVEILKSLKTRGAE
jgi:hypothetical protein